MPDIASQFDLLVLVLRFISGIVIALSALAVFLVLCMIYVESREPRERMRAQPDHHAWSNGLDRASIYFSKILSRPTS